MGEYKSDLMILAEKKIKDGFELSDCLVALSIAKTMDELKEISELYNLES